MKINWKKNLDDFILMWADEYLSKRRIQLNYRLHEADIEYYCKKAKRFANVLDERNKAQGELNISTINKCNVIIYTIRKQFESLFKQFTAKEKEE